MNSRIPLIELAYFTPLLFGPLMISWFWWLESAGYGRSSSVPTSVWGSSAGMSSFLPAKFPMFISET